MGKWGLDEWGPTEWGNEGFDPPVLVNVTTEFPNPAGGGFLFETRGGTIAFITGLNFFPEFIPQVLVGAPGGPYLIVAEGFLFDPEFDLRDVGKTALPGMPARNVSDFHLRVKTPAGLSNEHPTVMTDDIKRKKTEDYSLDVKRSSPLLHGRRR